MEDLWILNLNYILQLFFSYYFQWLNMVYKFHIIRGRKIITNFSILS